MKKHLIELDSLRGLAALSVLIGHFLIVYPMFELNTYGEKGLELLNLFKYTPLHIFWSGHQAVILFFVLSGFVLSLAFYKKDFVLTKQWYYTYLMKRVLRIYVPFIISTLIFVILFLIINPSIDLDLSDFVTRNLYKDINLSDLFGHLFLIGDYDTKAINPVIWSLVHEMRISIIFPFIMFIVVKYDTKVTIGIAMLIAILAQGLMFVFGYTGEAGIVYTLYFIPIFVIGALIAKNMEKIVFFVKNLTVAIRISLFIIGIILYTYPWLFYGIDVIHITVINDWATAVGTSLFIILGVSSKHLSNLLSLQLIAFTGKISYSLYLYHVPVLLLSIYLLYNYLAIWQILIISLILSYIAATISFYLIEKTSTNLGRRIIKQKKNVYPANESKHTS